MGTNIGGRLEGVRTTDEPISAVWFLPELFMTSPEEEQKKAAEAKAREHAKPDKPNTSVGDAFTFVGQLVGDAKNLAVDAVAGQHSGDKVLAGISPELAAQYKQGKDVQERIASGTLKDGHLNETDQKNLDAFNSVRKSISQVPLYDRDSLMRYVEKGIDQKARTTPHETAKQASPPARSESVKPASTEPVKPVRNDGLKPAASDAAKSKQSDTARLPQSESTKPTSHEASRPKQHDAPTSAQRDSVKAPLPELGKPSLKDAATAAQRENSSPAQRDAAKSPPSEIPKSPAGDIPKSSAGDIPKSPAGDIPKSPPRDIPKFPANEIAKPSPLSDARGFHSGETKSPAFTAFERRTSSDARPQQERKPGVSEAPASDSKARLQTSFADGGAHKNDGLGRTESRDTRVPFENMRRLLDERTASSNNHSHTAIAKAHSVIERAPEKPQSIDVDRSEHRTLNSASRTTLSEVKANLSPHQMQQLVRTSEERFPAGLRWQNTLQQSNADARTSIPQAVDRRSDSRNVQQDVQSGGKPPPAAIRQPGENLPPVNTQHTEAPHSDVGSGSRTGRINPGSPRTSEVSPPGAKTNLPAGKGDGPAGSSGVGPQANTLDAQRANTLDAQHAHTRSTWNANTRDAQSTNSRDPSPSTFEAGILTFHGRIQNRYITGAEIALAAIIAAAGAKRIRFDELPPPGSERAGQMPLVQSIEAFLPNNQKVEARGVSTTGQIADFISEKNADLVSQKQQQISRTEVGSKRSDSTSNSTEKSVDEDDVPGTARYLQKHHYKRRKILFGPQDTFVSIAESLVELRHDSRYAWLIADINLPRLKETYVDGKRVVEVRSRQEIEIPGEFDVEAFDLHRKDEYSAENLVTVVLGSQIDRELLDEHFGVFVDGGEIAVSAPPPMNAFPASSISPSLLSRNTVAGDASVLLPSLALNSANVLRVARQQLIEITQQALESGRKPISKLKNSLKRDRIKRNL